MCEELKDYRFHRGVALVIHGPVGSGKTTQAKKVAELTDGYWVAIPGNIELGSFGLGPVLTSANPSMAPSTLIVDAPVSKEVAMELEKLLKGDSYLCHRKYAGPILVRSPNVIICSNTPELPWGKDTRMFHLVELPAAPAPA